MGPEMSFAVFVVLLAGACGGIAQQRIRGTSPDNQSFAHSGSSDLDGKGKPIWSIPGMAGGPGGFTHGTRSLTTAVPPKD